MRAIFILIILAVGVFFYCGKNIREQGTGTFNGRVFSSFKKPYECKKVDFFKDAKLDYVPKGKCAGVTSYPDDYPLDVNWNREVASKYFATNPFPGKVSPSVKRETIELDLQYPLPYRAVSTGAYAAPNEEIQIEVPEEMVKFGLYVQIGVHTDNLTGKTDILRDPIVVENRKIENRITKLKNKRGGTVLLEASLVYKEPREAVPWWNQNDAVRNESSLLHEKFKVTFRNVIRAPRFVLGKTTPQEWVDELRCNPAPWAELEGKYVTFAVPSNVVRELNNPEPALNFWDAAVLSVGGLTGADKVSHYFRERFVPDIDISMGFMHSGYPIMTQLGGAQYAVGMERFDWSKPWSPENSILMNGYNIGHFHELAHNRQTGDPWITADLGEWSTNIFVTKANCEVQGYDPDHLFVAYNYDVRYEAFRYLNGDDSLLNKDLMKKWKNRFAGIADRHLANLFYIQLYRNFGFEAYKKVILGYQKIDWKTWDRDMACQKHDHAGCNKNKLNSFAVELSKAVSLDMTDYLNKWGYELTWGMDEVKKLNLPKIDPARLWTGIELGTATLQEGTFYDIANLKADGGLTVNVFRALKHAGAEVGVWNRSFKSDNTLFKFVQARGMDSVYGIIGKASERCIGLDADEKNVVLVDCNPSSPSQQWKAELVDYNGYPFYALYNMSTKKYLSIKSDKPQAEAKLEFSSKINTKSGTQLWILNDKE